MYCLSPFCCVCLSEGAKLQDINQLDVDGLPFINKLIFVSFGHEAIDFKVVRYICNECTQILQLAYKFKRACLMNHELLQIYSGQLKYFTGRVSEYQELYVNVERLTESEIKSINEANEPPIEINEEPTIKTVTITKISPKFKKKHLKCVICDAEFNAYYLLRDHYSITHKSYYKVIKTQEANMPKPVISYKCVICSNKLASLYTLTKHLQNHGTKIEIRKCKFCQTPVETNDTYKEHIMEVHADRSTSSCHLCQIVLENDFQFRRHMFLKHTPRKCKNCNETFFTNSQLVRHTETKHQMHKCQICDKPFILLRNLQTHMKSHEAPSTPVPEAVTPEIPAASPEPPVIIDQNPVDMFAISEMDTENIESEDTDSVPVPESLKSRPLFWHLRKKCNNCLSIFSSAASLKKHNCFEMNNMFQCNNCFIIYSKKSSFINHSKLCTDSRNTTNTPELQDSEIETQEIAENPETPETPQTEAINETTREPEIENVNENVNVNVTNLEDVEPVVKDENTLEIKEEILEDFVGNPSQTKEKSLEIRDVFTMTEYSEQTKTKESPKTPTKNTSPKTAKEQTPKKAFPKIKIIVKTVENNLEKTQNKPKRHETLFANPDNIQFSDSDSNPIESEEIQVDVDPLFNLIDEEPENIPTQETQIIQNIQINQNVQTIQNPPNIENIQKKKEPIKRRNSLWVDDTRELNESFIVHENTETVKKPPPKRRKSCYAEYVISDNSNSSESFKDNSEPQTLKNPPSLKVLKQRRASIWSEINDELNVVDTPIQVPINNEHIIKIPVKNILEPPAPISILKPHLNENIKEQQQSAEDEKLLPIILKTRRSIKPMKARRKTVVFETQTQSQSQSQTNVKIMEPADVNENIANKPHNSTIQAFKLRTIRRQSICGDGQMSNVADDLNSEHSDDSNYISVRKVSDINNDISS